MHTLIDRSLIPRAHCEYVVVADTHFMRPPGSRRLEFASRRLQTARTQIAVRLLTALEPDFVVHLGDLVQEYPDTADFEPALEEALGQLRSTGLEWRFVPGNHDVGDKPDPTMPVHPVTAASLDAYERRYGRSYYFFDHGEVRHVVLNAQLFNTGLRQAAEQQEWMESLLDETPVGRLVVFLHMPPYLLSADEPHLGHYDNLGEPARSWLLDWVDRSRPELLFSGHVHFGFYGLRGPTHMVVVPSTSFTRPGFGHLFTSGPPPEQGRDDAPKLGFYWCRVFPQRTVLHWIRTDGLTAVPDRTVLLTPGGWGGWKRGQISQASVGGQTLTEHQRDGQRPDPPPGGRGAGSARRHDTAPNAAAPVPVAWERSGGATDDTVDHGASLGVSLAHPLSNVAEVPVTWPSVVRQRVRNDYPLLACMELGVDRVRVPWSDLLDSDQRQRLQLLVDEGVRIQAFVPVDVGTELRPGLDQASGWGADVEIQLAGKVLPDDAMLDHLRWMTRTYPDMRLVLAPVLPNHRLPGKQHPRTRVGYVPEELPAVNDTLVGADLRLSALCRLDIPGPWQSARQLAGSSTWQGIPSMQGIVALPTTDTQRNAQMVAEARLAIALLPQACLWIDPLLDLDRTMDVRHGLLDTLCNPRPAFQVMRCAHALLRDRSSASRHPWSPVRSPETAAWRLLSIGNACTVIRLLVPRDEVELPIEVPLELVEDADMICDLMTGRRLDARIPGPCMGPVMVITSTARPAG